MKKITRKTITFLKHLLPVTWYRKLTNRQKLYVMTGVIAFLLVLIPSIIYSLSNATKSEAAWFDDSWGYRKEIPVANNTTTENNVYIAVTLDTSDTSRFQADCGDLRFTNFNGKLLSYYIASGCQTDSTVIHVNFDTFMAGAQTIYYYYGNPSAPNGFSNVDFTTEASDYSIGSFGSEEEAQGPVAYWKFDEGYGSIASDATSNKYHGTLYNSPTWKDESECISGKCLYFDGTDDYVSAGNPSSLQFDTSAFSVSVWAKTTKAITNSTFQGIISKGGYNSGFELRFSVAASGTRYVDGWIADETFGVKYDFEPNTWYQITFTRDDSGNYNLYINGNNTVKAYENTVNKSIGTSNWEIGRMRGSNSYPLKGYIDEVKIYNYARSTEQIRADYASRDSVKGVSSQIGSSDLGKSLSNGLVGYWKMDEATWSGTLADIVDSSGNGNTGTAQGATNAKAYPTTGKYGNGGYFDGVDDYVSASYNSSLKLGNNGTISLWFKPINVNSGTHNIIGYGGSSYGNGYLINQYGTSLVIYWKNVSGNITKSNYFTSGNWYHIVLTNNNGNLSLYGNGILLGTGTSGGAITGEYTTEIGGSSFSSWKTNSNIDEVRIYNRALSSNEVSALYNYAPGPVGYWNFEEGQGGTVNDNSGNGNTGTWNGSGNHWTNGKYGKGGNFNGGDDYVRVGDKETLHIKDGSLTVEYWFNTTTGVTNYRAVLGNANSGSWHILTFNDSHYFRMLDNLGNPAYDFSTYRVNIRNNEWVHAAFVAERNGDQMTVHTYENGTLKGSSTKTLAGSFNNTSILDMAKSYNKPIKIDEVKIYNYARTPGQIIEDMNASHPIGGSPIASQVGYWDFEEGYGATTHNLGNYGVSGNITFGTDPPAWDNNGKIGKAISFNGTTSYATSGIDLATSSPWTYSFWIKPTTLNTGEIINAGYHNPRILISNSSISVAYYNTAAEYKHALSGSSLTANNWYHITVSYDGSSFKLYYNGKKNNEVSITDGVRESTSYIGFGYKWAVPFKGFLDEVKVYNAALTDEQIKLDYNQGKSLVLGSLSDTSQLTGGSVASNSANTIYCVPGSSDPCSQPVGEWNFEEGQGGTVNDKSGNENTGTWYGTGNHWTSGKYGKGGGFNGSDDYVSLNNNIGNFSTEDFTINTWVKVPFSGTGEASGWNGIIAKGWSTSAPAHTWGLVRNSTSNNIVAYYDTSDTGGTWNAAISTGALSNGWHHISITRSGTTYSIYADGIKKSSNTYSVVSLNNESSLKFGSSGNSSSFLQGNIDNIKFFDYARTPAQIAWDYNQGKPIGHWDFDECQGVMAHDSADLAVGGTRNDGTINIGATGTQTTVGTCSTPTDGSGAWYNGSSGKYNYSMSFDGTDDYVSIADSTSMDSAIDEMTFAAWVKPASDNNSGDIWKREGVWYSYYDSDHTFNFTTYDTTPQVLDCTKALTAEQWNHVTLIYSDITNTKSIYVNGKLAAQDTNVTGQMIGGSALEIGRVYTSYFNGQIDDVRIYNYALTPTQVKTLYNQNSAVRWGPLTGSP